MGIIWSSILFIIYLFYFYFFKVKELMRNNSRNKFNVKFKRDIYSFYF